MELLVLAFLPLAFATSIDNHIVNGGNANIANFPYQGSLRVPSGGHTCGCVLVSTGWAISAAHCGANTGYSTQWGTATHGYGTVIGLNWVYNHPYYGQGTGAHANDVASLQLVAAATGANISPVTIPYARIQSSNNAVISGWGVLCDGCGPPSTLQYRNIPVITDTQCKAMMGDWYNPDVHICVYDGVGGACFGDSGGPLLANGVVHGIASYVYPGCNSAYPSVYARVTYYHDWFCTWTWNNALGC